MQQPTNGVKMTSADERFATSMAMMQQMTATCHASNAYKSEYMRYCKWCRDNLPHEEACSGYITSENVDAYFQRQVVSRIGQHNTLIRIAAALQWFYSNVENPGGTLVVNTSRITAEISTPRTQLTREQAVTEADGQGVTVAMLARMTCHEPSAWQSDYL